MTRDEVLKKVQDYIVSNINNIKFIVEFEDGRHQATLQDFIKAMEIAKLKELQNFFKSKSLFFEDGYIKVITR